MCVCVCVVCVCVCVGIYYHYHQTYEEEVKAIQGLKGGILVGKGLTCWTAT